MDDKVKLRIQTGDDGQTTIVDAVTGQGVNGVRRLILDFSDDNGYCGVANLDILGLEVDVEAFPNVKTVLCPNCGHESEGPWPRKSPKA